MIKYPFLYAQNMGKNYGEKSVLRQIHLAFDLGVSLSIQGKSGQGKSTLLYILGLLDKPTYGEYFLHNIEVLNLTQTQKAILRNQYLGFIFQEHHLVDYLSVLENMMLPFYYRKQEIELDWKKYVCYKLQINDLEHRRPSELSLGQQQRVAIARALVTQPKMILADEPTASLDDELASIYMELMLDYVETKQALYIMVTHDKGLAELTQHQFVL